MATSSPDYPSTERARGSLITRALAAIGLLLGEYLLISLLFDARGLLERSGPRSLLAYMGDAASVALVAAAAALAFTGPALRRAVAALPKERDRPLWPKLLAHALAYGTLIVITGQVFGAHGGKAPTLGLALGWVFAAITVAATWLPLALPWRALRTLWPRLTSALVVGSAAGGAAWIAGQASAAVWTKLAPPTLSTVGALLGLFVDEVIVDTAALAIGTDRFGVHVAPVCSGFEGIGLIVVFLSGYMAVERRALRFPRVLALLPIAVITVWVANAMRIALLILIGSYVSPELAVGGFHSKAGWLLFCIIALGFVALARARPFAIPEQSPSSRAENPAAAFLMPLLTLLGTALVTGLFSVGFDAFYPLRMACTLAVLAVYRKHYRSLAWSPHIDSMAIGVVIFGLWHLLAHGADAATTRAFAQTLSGLGPLNAGLWVAARVAGACLVVPIAEELAFRGYLLRRLMAADFTAADPRKLALPAWLVSSLAFGILHEDWLAATLGGMGYALAQQRRGRVTDAIVAHAVTNLLLSAEALIFGQLHWWA